MITAWYNRKCLLLWLLLLAAAAAPANAADIFVSINGSDTNAGSREKPLATLSMALRKARELRRLNDPSVNGGIRIFLGGGRYPLAESVFIRPEDSGTPGSPTSIEALPGEHPVLSGGMPITGWQKLQRPLPGLPKQSAGKVWMARLPIIGSEPINFRQLWVDGKKAVRARDRNADSMNRILSWNHADQSCWIPLPKTADLRHVRGMEMLIHQWWATAVLRIQSMVQGDSAKLVFEQPERRIQSEHPWPAPWISAKTGNSAFYLTNALQFLDQPGEWYADVPAGLLYYYPRSGEDLSKADVVVPVLEQLVQIKGTIDNPVSYLHFSGISFQHASWLRPSRQGHVAHQAGMFMTDAYKLKIPGTPDKKGLENQAWIGRPAAAVEVSYAHHTRFSGCKFQHLASTGLDYQRGTHDDEVTGNLFKDIGGSGLLAGVFADEGFEIHRPYNPTDQREVCTNELISNNLVTDVTNEDWGAVGIGAGYVKGISIEHNEVSNVSYSAISLGWGWTKIVNAMSNNRVYANKLHHYAKHMYDVSAIYTLSAQPGSLISENYIDSIYVATYAHDPHHWFYLYTDEGSSYFTVTNNWTPSRKYLQNANGPGNTWTNNGPMVHDSVKSAAGLQEAYKSLLVEKTVDASWPVNWDTTGVAGNANANPFAAINKPLVIELVVKSAEVADITAFLQALGGKEGQAYQWKNHLVYFGQLPDTSATRKRLEANFPAADIKIYTDRFYTFDRSSCPGATLSPDWDNVVITANMVADPRRQQEYLDYHARQSRDWPELSRGFCQADFQQLVIYRQGPQLILVISIPKGADLATLNPKTMENNPRVTEWNTLMKQYQRGIAGTASGEVWVELKPVNATK